MRYIILSILLLLGYTCNAQYEPLLNKTYAERYLQIDSLFYYNWTLRSNNELFNEQIAELENEAIAAKDVELQCEAKLLQLAQISTNLPVDTTQIELFGKDIIYIAHKHNLTQIEVRCRQFIGRYYLEKRGMYLAGLNQFLKSYFLLQKLSVAEFPSKKEHLYSVAHAYFTFRDFVGTKIYLLEAEATPMPEGKTILDYPNKVHTYLNLYNTLGLVYREEKQFDSAIYYFEKVSQQAKKIKDTAWVGIAAGNVGISYYMMQEYDKAIPLLEFDVEQSFKRGESDNLDNGLFSLIKLIDIYLRQNNLATAHILIDSARQVVNKTYEPNDHIQRLAVHMARYYAAIGNPDLAYRYLDTAREAEKVMRIKKNDKRLANLHQQLALEAHLLEVKTIEEDKRLQIIKRNSIIIGVILLAIFVVIFVNRQRIVFRQQSLLAGVEKEKAELELVNAEKQLKDFTKSIIEKNELINSFSSEIRRYKKLSEEDNLTEDNEKISQLQESIILTAEQWDEFKLNFEKVHPNFFFNLRKKIPTLTSGEIRFMSLNKLNLNNREMANMLGIGMSGIRNYKSRVRKKLNISDDKELDELLKEL